MAVTVKWLENKQFVGIDSTGHSVVLSAPADGVGMKPSDLLLVSLAGCTAYDVVEILSKKRQKLESLTIEVDGEQDSEAPWTFRKFHTIYRFKGELDPKAVEQAIELSESKYCSVAATLRPAAELTWEYEIES
jgi:putative redox protein